MKMPPPRSNNIEPHAPSEHSRKGSACDSVKVIPGVGVNRKKCESPAETSYSAAPSSDMTAFLEVCNLHKRFAGVHALRGVSLLIERGEIYHLLGENGCGKSTLIKIISGDQAPDEGHLLIEGRSYTKLSPIESLAAGIETVYQDLSLLPNLSVAENIALTEQLVRHGGKLARRLDRRQLASTAARALSAVNLPVDITFLTTQVSALPIAVRQLIAIARAIATQARMVIMDEPTASLNRREVERLIGVVTDLRSRGVAVLFVTHKLDECLAIGGQVIILRDGQKVLSGPIRDYGKRELSFWMTGRHVEDARYRNAPCGEEVLLAIKGLQRKDAFVNINFTLRRGEILGVTGLLDSGRNELALALAGVRPAEHGIIALDSREIKLRTPADAIHYGIGYVPEDRLDEGLFLDKPIRDNIIVAVLGKLIRRFGMLDGLKCEMLAKSTINDLQIATPDVWRPVQSLSGGNQQRVLIGRWLTIAPKVLILHGPTVGVDVGSKDTIFRIIQRLAAEGLGVVIISDDLPELLQNCDRILMMHKGLITHTFNAENLAESSLYKALINEAARTGDT